MHDVDEAAAGDQQWEPTEGPGSGDDRYRFRPATETADVTDTYGWCPCCGGETAHTARCALAAGWSLLGVAAA